MNLLFLKNHLSVIFPFCQIEETKDYHTGTASSLFLRVSMDAKETWPYDIIHNSRWALFAIHFKDHKLYAVATSHTLQHFRKCVCKNEATIIVKLKTWKEQNENPK